MRWVRGVEGALEECVDAFARGPGWGGENECWLSEEVTYVPATIRAQKWLRAAREGTLSGFGKVGCHRVDGCDEEGQIEGLAS